MTDRPADYGREVRDIIVKSSLTGVAATVLAVTIFSPAGFGGMIGTSLASGFGGSDPSASAANDPYVNLPAYPSPITHEELSNIRGELARTTASLEITRAATESKIDHIRTIALTQGVATFAPMPQTAQVGAGLRLALSEPAAAPAAVSAPAPVEATVTPVSYVAPQAVAEYRDPHLELADLLLAHENF